MSLPEQTRLLAHLTLRLQDGSVALSTSATGKPVLFNLGDGSLSPALEKQLKQIKIHDKSAFTLMPEEAFGKINPDLIQHFSRRHFIEIQDPKPGAIMLFQGVDGKEIPGVIREVIGDSVTVDFNHPLAGQIIDFDVELLEINPAKRG